MNEQINSVKLAKLEISELDKYRWDKRKLDDSSNFINEIKNFVEVDGRGISGNDLFPINLDLSNSFLSLRSIKLRDGSEVDKGIFQALCPELECFVSFVNWLGSEESRSEKHVQYQREIKDFINSKSKSGICNVFGNYRLALNDYAKILPFRGDLFFTKEAISKFSWKNAPFIKRTEETFFANSSPIFMSTINKIGEGSSEARLFCFSAPFIITEINNENLTINLLYCNGPYQRETDVKKLLDRTQLESLKSTTRTFIGLFADVVQNYKRDIYLIDISNEKETGNLLLAHLILTRLYYNYLIHPEKLEICSEDDLKKRINKTLALIEETYKLKVTLDSYEEFYNTYLKPSIYRYQGNIYYLTPLILAMEESRLNKFLYLNGKFFKEMQEIEFNEVESIDTRILLLEEEIKKDEVLFGVISVISKETIGNKKAILEKLKKIKDLMEFSHEIRALRFITLFNKYSKRTLIKLISNDRAYNPDHEWKWKI